MLQHTLDLLTGFSFGRTILVTVPAVAENVDTAAEIVINRRPQAGLSKSVRLGVLAAEPGDSLFFFTGDQPLLDRETVAAILDADDGASIVYPQGPDGAPKNPSLFAPRFREALLALEGDEGGRQIRRLYPEACRPVPIVDAKVLLDVDTMEDYERVCAIWEREVR